MLLLFLEHDVKGAHLLALGGDVAGGSGSTQVRALLFSGRTQLGGSLLMVLVEALRRDFVVGVVLRVFRARNAKGIYIGLLLLGPLPLPRSQWKHAFHVLLLC